jgi:hypothetical protein
MKSRTITTIGIIAAILMTVSGTETAFARGGGGGGGSHNGKGARMSQMGHTNQYQYKHQNQYQYRQENGTFTERSGNDKRQGDQTQTRSRTQLRDPSRHQIEASE